MSAPQVKDLSILSAKRTAFGDLLRFSVCVLLVTNFVTAYHFARATLDDPRDFLSYSGTFGPLAYRRDVPTQEIPEAAYGPQQTVFHAGDRFSWTTKLCVNQGVTIIGHAELVRVAQSGVGEQVIDRRDTPVTPDAHRCGARLGSFGFATDALPGTYEVRRWVDVEPPPGGGLMATVRRLWPLQVRMEPLVVQLVTTINTAPSGKPSTDVPSESP